MTLSIRDTDYASALRLPVDDTPTLDGINQFTGSNYFDTLNIRVLYVSQYAEFRGPLTAISATSAAVFGTVDPQDFRLLSNNIVRAQLTSAGAVYFASALPPTTVTTVVDSDNFQRANEKPMTGWTDVSAGAFEVVSNTCMFSATTGLAQALAYRTAGVWGADQDAQITVASAYSSQTAIGPAVRVTSAVEFTAFAWNPVGNVPQTVYRLQFFNAAVVTVISSVTGGVLAAGDTLRLLVSAGIAYGFRNGTLLASGSTGSGPSTGRAGLYALTGQIITSSINNWQSTALVPPPLSAENIAFQTSALFYSYDGSSYARWLRLPNLNSVQLGDQASYTFMGLQSAAFSAGFSAIHGVSYVDLPRGISAVGTGASGLSGVIALSAGLGMFISAVTGNAIELVQTSASASFIWPATSAGGDLIISAGGRLGINTSPANYLHVVTTGAFGTAFFESQTNGANPVITIKDNSPGQALIGAFNFTDSAGIAQGQIGYQFGTGNQFLKFKTNNAVRMRLNSVGNLSVGADVDGKETLDVRGTFQASAVASATLPAASATRDGMMIIDLTASAMVIYANAKRLSAAFTAF